MDVNYGNSAPFTLGVEEELQLVNAESYELTSRYEEVFGEAEHADKRIRPELLRTSRGTPTSSKRSSGPSSDS